MTRRGLGWPREQGRRVVRPRGTLVLLVLSLSAARALGDKAGAEADAASPPGTLRTPPEESVDSQKPPGAATGLAEVEVPKARYDTGCEADGAFATAQEVFDLKPPTPEQQRALLLLESEADVYQADALDFERRLEQVVRHHYADRRRRLLEQLERELSIEKKALGTARNETIARLESFVARYQGDATDPQATPDAMFRLAALYEERARSDYDADLGELLKPSIALYRAVATQFPSYRESAAVLYYLAHAYTEAGRLEEAQQAFRSLVCANRYQILESPGTEHEVIVQALPQDHEQSFWNEWYNRNPIPLDQLGTRLDQNVLGVREEELSYRDPYQGCKPMHQELSAGAEPRYVAEAWWQVGNFHFDQLDQAGGPFALNRAVSAYGHALAFKRPPLYGVAMYKQAWALFKQQRYRDAIRWFVELLRYADEQERLTGDPGADFRAEAYTYIAGSLTYVDLNGPPAGDPFIPRSDALDLETDPLVAEEKMAVAIERVQDSRIIPQNEPWSVEIYKALGREFIDLNQYRNAIFMMNLLVRRFPLDRDIPTTVAQIGDLQDELARLAPPGSAARKDYERAALEARTSLSAYVGQTAWTEANKDDVKALLEAEELVRLGLRRAAADHTNRGRALKERALQLSNQSEQVELLGEAIESFRLAAKGWGGVLSQDERAPDSYESRFWLADAHFWVAVLQVPLGRRPTTEEVTVARRAAEAVRDSNEDDRYEQPAAYYAVTLAEKILDAEAKVHEESGGVSGLARRSEVTFRSVGDKREVEVLDVPQQVKTAVCARDEYNARIPLDEDPEQNGLLYATQAADYFFVYGQFDEARRRYIPLYQKYCGKNQWGYQAWERLISMSNFQGNAKQSRMLVESMSCAYDAETRLAEEAIRSPVRQGVAYFEARDLFERAMKMEDGPARDKTWRETAAAYRVALDAAPERDEAPEAAMNGAYAYKQVGEYDKAIELYSLFIKEYGNESVLAKLESEDQARFAQRVDYLSRAHQALASAYVLFFDYPNAATTFDEISRVQRFPREERKEAAKQALMLYINLGDESGTERARDTFIDLGASAEERAESEFLIASGALKDWDAQSPDRGANQRARGRVITAMDGYYDRNKTWLPAARFVVQAAYYAAVARRAGHSQNEDTWWKNTIASFSRYAAAAPKEGGQNQALGTREASMAAEAEYTLIDQELRKDFDYEAGHHRYKGTPVEVIGQYAADAKVAKEWYVALQGVVDRYASQKWATVAIARQGSLYDSLRTGLYNTRPPDLKMFTAQQERALRIAENSDNEDLLDKADQIRLAVREAWRTKRDQELDSADRIVVDRYAVSVTLAKRYNLSDPAVTRAIRRLAFMTDVIGEAKVSEFTAANKELTYQAGMFQRMRPGLLVAGESDSVVLPAPWGLGARRQASGSAADAGLGEGDRAFRSGDLKKAEASYGAARKADAKNADAVFALGIVRARVGDNAGAEKLLRQASAMSPRAGAPVVGLALLLARSEQEAPAVALLKGALSKVEDRATVLAALAELASLSGRSGEAQELAQKALKENPDYRPAMVTLAKDHYRARRLDLALYTLKGILDGYGESNPPRDATNAEAQLLRGDIFAARGLRGPAMDAYLAAVKVRPDLVRAHLGLSTYMLEAGNARGAAPHLGMAVRFDLSNVAAHLMLGDAYRLLGQVQSSLREFEWVIAAAPALAEPHYDLGLLLLSADQVPAMTELQATERAIEHFRTYKTKAPRGGADDVDELLTRASTKKALLEAKAKQQLTPAGEGSAQVSEPDPAAGTSSAQKSPREAPPTAAPATAAPATAAE